MVYWSSGLCSVAIAAFDVHLDEIHARQLQRRHQLINRGQRHQNAGMRRFRTHHYAIGRKVGVIQIQREGVVFIPYAFRVHDHASAGTRTLGCADSGRITTLLAAKLVSSRFSVRVSSLSHTPFGYTITRPPAVSAARLRRMHSTLEGEISIETTVCAPASSAWRVKSPSLAPQSKTTSPAGP